MLPQTNARLISIAPPGATEDWDQPAGPTGTPKWQGNTDAYVLEKVRTVYAQGTGAMVKQRDIRIIIAGTLKDAAGQPLTINTGDVVTYRWRGTTHARRVMDYSAPDLPSVPLQNYVTVHLNPEAVETAMENQ